MVQRTIAVWSWEGRFMHRSAGGRTAGVPVGPSGLGKLLLQRGDSIELVVESWATPSAWAENLGHNAVLAVLQEYAPEVPNLCQAELLTGCRVDDSKRKCETG
jgi:hypothetical protein